MSVNYGTISKVTSEITDDISNHNGKHNSFVVVTDSENHYPSKVDPVILRFDEFKGEWIFVADKTIINFGYLTEIFNVIDNDILLHKEPLDRVVWDIYVLDDHGNKTEKINNNTLLVTNNMLSGLLPYKGRTLSLMYAFGDKEDDEVVVPVDVKKNTGYKNQEVDEIKYDGPYDMNDILKGLKYPPPFSSFDRQILERVKLLEDMLISFEARKLYTTTKILIEDNEIKLPYMNIGGVVHDMALIYLTEDVEDRIIELEVTCTAIDGVVKFDEEDELNGKYAKVTYLADMSPLRDL